MTLRDLPDLIKPAPPLMADDTVAKAVRLLRARGLPALSVAQGGQLVGLVQEDDLTTFAAESPDPTYAAASTRVGQVLRPIGPVVRDYQEVRSALHLLQERGASCAPVLTNDGRYLGLVLRRDLLAVMVGESPAPPIAGLATPFGVHLTTGALRAGVSDLALAATGATLWFINLLALGVVFGLSRLANRLTSGSAFSGALPSGYASVIDALASYALGMMIFLLLLRISPLTGIHAAEHMVVHAMEEGEDLTVQKVMAMPRVHPRCGTNMMALLILLVISMQFLSTVDERIQIPVLLGLVLVILLAWRRLGAGLQRWVTTRRPTKRQLAGAIIVGQELLAKVKNRPGARASLPRRVWNAGFTQVVIGFLALAVAQEYLWPLMLGVWSHLKG